MGNMATKDLLRIYLRDHHAGAVAGRELVKRSAKANEGTPFGELLGALESEIASDLDVLESIMSRLGVSPAKGKDAAAWTAEKLGRLKLNGSFTDYSPLSRVVEFEGLSIMIQSKKALWVTLEQLGADGVDATELAHLKTRAEDQQGRIEEARREAARIAFSSDATIT
jgi:hypothetical protein